MAVKPIVKSYTEAIIFSETWIALSALAMTLSTYIVLQNDFSKVSPALLSLVFFSSFFIYNLHIIGQRPVVSSRPGKEQWKLDHRAMLKLLLFVSLIVIVASCMQLSLKILLFLLHLAILSVLYVLPVYFRGKHYSLRQLPLMKIFVLGYVWTCVTAVLPVLQIGLGFNSKMVFLLLERFLFIFALSIPFDIRDYHRDKKEGLLTIPGLIGLDASKYTAKALLAGFVLLSFVCEEFSFVSLARAVSVIPAWIFISRAHDRQPDFFYTVGIDGVLIFHFCVLVLIRYFDFL